MANKSEYVKRLVAEEIAFPEAVLTALKHFKKTYRNRDLPAGLVARREGMEEMLEKFCTAYNIPAIAFAVDDLSENGDSGSSSFCSISRTITMRGKLSVITFLHEFAHALLPDTGEEGARKWSLTLFKKVYPRAFERLEMGEPGENAFLLRVPGTAGTSGAVRMLGGAPAVPVSTRDFQALMVAIQTAIGRGQSMAQLAETLRAPDVPVLATPIQEVPISEV